MRPYIIYAIGLICFSIASCSNPNGKYVVIKIENPNSGNDTINSVLKTRLQGKEFDIKFNNEYAMMEDNEHRKAYLSVEKNRTTNANFYQKKVSINRVSYTASLYKGNDGKLMYILRVDGRANEIFSPVQLGNLPTWGEARCWLAKVVK